MDIIQETTKDVVSNEQSQQEVKQPEAEKETYTLEELKVKVKAAENKTYTKALKELGVTSVKEFKDKQALLATQQDELTKAIKQQEELTKLLEDTKKENKALKTEQIFTELQVLPEYREDLIKLAEGNVSEEKDLKAVLKELVQDKYKHTVTKSTSTFKIGSEKHEQQSDPANKLSDETLKRFPWLRSK